MTDEPGPEPEHGLGRRAVLGRAGLGVAGLAAGLAIGSQVPVAPPPRVLAGAAAAPAPVRHTGIHQPGISRPATPQTWCVLTAVDLPGIEAAAGIAEVCAGLQQAIATITSTERSTQAGLLDGPGDVTITIGLGPRLVRAIDPSLPGAQDLPMFAGDELIAEHRRGGDLLLGVHGSDPNDVDAASAHLALVQGARTRWRQRGFRGRGEGTIARNPLGFHDGVIVPRGEAELAEHVWIPDGPARDGTILVIRRLRLDHAAFAAQPLHEQESVIGRRRADGVPLTGGAPDAEADLLARTPEGEFVLPARSHVRAAHPSFTASNLMLRRSYAYDDGAQEGSDARDSGLLFICAQRELRTFVRTQQRLDEGDDLMRFARPTGSATFLVLPGYDADRPLGAPVVHS